MTTNYAKQIEVIKNQISMMVEEEKGVSCSYEVEDNMVFVKGYVNGKVVMEDIIDMEEFKMILKANGKVWYECGAQGKIMQGIMGFWDMLSYLSNAVMDPTSEVVMETNQAIIETKRHGEVCASVYSW